MTEPPRRLPITAEERLRTVVSRVAGGSDAGSTRFARPVAPARQQNRSRWGGVEVIAHGDDGTVSRPDAAVVYWIGAATPANGEPFDFWYTATVT